MLELILQIQTQNVIAKTKTTNRIMDSRVPLPMSCGKVKTKVKRKCNSNIDLFLCGNPIVLSLRSLTLQKPEREKTTGESHKLNNPLFSRTVNMSGYINQCFSLILTL